jgi:hypothetical protein
MRKLHEIMDEWQKNNNHFLSVSIQKDGNNFCCIALAGKREVVICDPENDLQVRVSGGGNLDVTAYGKSEVVICDPEDECKARVSDKGSLQMWAHGKSEVVICDPKDDDKARVRDQRLMVNVDNW